ncbi:MAG TPA: hypothetical protein DDW54_01840 [Clostridiales bacterium]|nr:hypothetical protein [Clostridiales bacterium]
MGKLLKYEFYKLRKQKSFIICTLTLLLIIFFTNAFSENVTAASAVSSAFSGGYLTAVIIGVFVSVFTCEDYEQQLVKNIYSKGYKRTEVYFAKFIATVSAALIVCALTSLFAYFIGLVKGGAGTFEDDAGRRMFSNVLTLMVCVCFFFGVASAIRKIGGVIAVNVIAPVVVFLILSAIDSKIKADFNLTTFWFVSFFDGSIFSLFAGEPISFGLKTGLSAGYIVLFIIVGWLLNRKTQA